MPENKVFISSTSKDLPDHRKAAIHFAQRLGFGVETMENFPADTDGAVALCKEKVLASDVYVGILAHRYGWQPYDAESITHMEYQWATEKGIPRLIFIIDEDHPWPPKLIEDGDKKKRLTDFKNHLMDTYVIRKFTDPDSLKEGLFLTLPEHRYKLSPVEALTLTNSVNIPTAPEPYIAHTYSLLRADGLIGRNAELNLLTDWVTRRNSQLYNARILNVVAIGGMGKSALTWHWFNNIAPLEMPDLAGRVWWSFYETDARMENFLPRLLSYLTGQPESETRKITREEQETLIIHWLNQRNTLLVLDGLERILIAYSSMTAAYQADTELDKETANVVAGAIGLPESAAQSFTGEVRRRKAVDPRDGRFLQKLATLTNSRVLISTRLYPLALQMVTGHPVPGASAIFLTGLADDDALALWRSLGVSGTREALLPLFTTFDSHPLLIQALAGEVARYRKAPGDFDQWRDRYPDFNPFTELDLRRRQSHVLGYAMRDLTPPEKRLLETVAAFRMAASYDTLLDVMVEKGEIESERDLDKLLDELEDRGLLGWDRNANRYDLHPIVRGVVWSSVGEDDKRTVYERLHDHFEAAPTIDEDDVESLDDLTPAIELYQTLVGLGRLDDALDIFDHRLSRAIHFRLSSQRQSIELLEQLFPQGTDELPALSRPDAQAWTLNALAAGYHFSGQPGRAVPLLEGHIAISREREDGRNQSIGLSNLADAARLSGALYTATQAAREGLGIGRNRDDRFREAITLQWLGLALGAAAQDGARLALERPIAIDKIVAGPQALAVDYVYLAQLFLWQGEGAAAAQHAATAWELAHHQRNIRDFIDSARRQGEAALLLNDHATAEERLLYALTEARKIEYAQEELPALIALAELRRQQNKPDEARARLDDVWDLAERGPYPLFHADAYNVLAQLERDAGNTDKAIAAATKAYQYAWCDGPPWAYHWGLEKAKAHLAALGAPEPNLPPFSMAGREPMPDVEINPKDDYWVDPETLG
jgi:tetratricopeptide (TPR) repeat protein